MFSIVIADDEPLICNGISSLISSNLPECNIMGIFHDGTLLYDFLQSSHPDILIVDIEMPGKSGLDIASFLFEKQSSCYIIIITAYHKFEYANKAIQYHVNSFLTKPFESNELIRVLNDAINDITLKQCAKISVMNNTRSLLRNLIRHYELNSVFPDNIMLCNGTTNIADLHCMEITYNDFDYKELSKEEIDNFERQLQMCAEKDSVSQSVFLIEFHNTHITILTFYKDCPDISFTQNVNKLIFQHLGISISPLCCEYRSLYFFCRKNIFQRTMDSVASLLKTQRLTDAKNLLTSFSSSLQNTEKEDFFHYLESNYDSKNTEDIFRMLSDTNTPSHHIMNCILEYIDKNYSSSSLSREVIADYVGISVSHFTRLFARHMNTSFSSYLVKIRMEHAAELLSASDLSTSQIADAVGFYSPEYFRTSFKNYYGLTPRNYRLLHARKDS